MSEIKVDIKRNVFNDVYFPLTRCQSRYLIFYGGAGSGKSVFVAQRYITKLLGDTTCNLLCVRKYGNTLRDSVFAEILKVIHQWKLDALFKVNQSDMRIKCINGNEVLFRGLDDVEKLKSVTFKNGELTDVWVEEASETDENDIQQLDVRLRGIGSKKQMVLTFNPIDVNHWLKHKFFDRRVEDCTILHTTYKDNRFLDDDYIRLLESYKETDPYYFDVYCRGMWGVYGKTIFNAQQVNDQLAKNIKPIKVGNFVKDGTLYRFVEDESGDICIYEDVKERTPYVIGCDTAGEGSDYSVAQVLDNTTGKQVATLRSHADEDIVVNQFEALGYHYNTALLGIESNFSTYPIKKLQERDYPMQFMRETEDSITNTPQKRFGFKTTSITRPLILANLIAVARESISLIQDKSTLEEMLTFVRNEKGRPEAKSGSHDDCIMALAISHYIRTQQDTTVAAPPEDDEWKDDDISVRITPAEEYIGTW